MNKRITLKYPSGTKKVNGADIPNYASGATVWAYKRINRGKEFVEAMATHNTFFVTWKIRYKKDITADWRVQEGTTIYEIIAPPIEDENGRYLLLETKVVS